MSRLIEYDKCRCSSKKQVVSITCRKCYIKDSSSPIELFKCECGVFKHKYSKTCMKCTKKIIIDKTLNRTIRYYWNKHKGSPNAYVPI